MKIKAIMALTAAAFALTGTVAAQTYPTKPITIVVPYAAGGNVDTAARVRERNHKQDA